MNKIYIILLTLSIIYAQEFNQRPYGSDYFDIAWPFSVEALNNNDTILGDVNYDNNIHILDVIMMVNMIFGIEDMNLPLADLNPLTDVPVNILTRSSSAFFARA